MGGSIATFVELAVVVASVLYAVLLFTMSRRPRPGRLPVPDSLFFVFFVPCLNEETVIGACLQRLLSIPYANLAVLVIDDGSDDATAEIASRHDPSRVWVLRRSLPDARRGKGAALNAAYRHLLTSGLLEGRDPADVIVGVVDADGRLDSHAVYEVGPYFADPAVGAAQVGVRMYNASESLLARMQDAEFTIFTEVYQRARVRLGSTGLGGNGQFNRLSALSALGEEPWRDCLTEDLDLGVRLLTKGWTNVFVPTASVAQQALHSPRRLIRQRARWFQGHLQCWRLIPLVLRSKLPIRAAGDIFYHLTAPILILIMSVAMGAYGVAVVELAVQGRLEAVMLAGHGLVFAAMYIVAFGLAPMFAYVYWLANPDVSAWRALAYGHLYCVYGYLWIPAGWIACWRVLRRRQGWAKTARTADQVPGVDIIGSVLGVSGTPSLGA